MLFESYKLAEQGIKGIRGFLQLKRLLFSSFKPK